MTAAPATVADALQKVTAALAKAKVREPRREARLLLAIATATPPLTLLTEPERCISANTWAAVERAVARRSLGEPISRIAGQRGFWSLDLTISPAVLDPRPETELLIERVLAHLGESRGEPLQLLDLGTGSGCLLLALLSELPQAIGVGVDCSPAALAVASANAAQCGLADRALWVAADWARPIRGRFDVIVANPPYIPAGALATLDRSVRAHDPASALDGGPDGLSEYRQILPMLPELLKQSGIACLEVGRGQAAIVAANASALGFAATIHKDFAEIDRCVALTLEKYACIAPQCR
tara:strand:- start:711 stop:1601 length:891 start_codon:yes stop_codon:yes gene_type:complete